MKSGSGMSKVAGVTIKPEALFHLCDFITEFTDENAVKQYNTILVQLFISELFYLSLSLE
jgi:hypothetical protein